MTKLLDNYFLRRFFGLFSVILPGLILLFSSADVLVRLIGIPLSLKLGKLFLFMLPMVCLFAVPIATALSVSIVVGSLFTYNEFLFFELLHVGRVRLERIVGLFAIVIALGYAPLVFEYAPRGYFQAKQHLIQLARQRIENAPPGQFYHMGPTVTIFCKDKIASPVGLVFKKLFFSWWSDGKQYYAISRRGELLESEFVLTDGTIMNKDEKRWYSARFSRIELDLKRLFDEASVLMQHKQVKFLTTQELLAQKDTNDAAWCEWHKRIGQVLWQLLIPFLLLWSMVLLARRKSNVLLSVVLSGLFFLASYLSLNTAFFLLQRDSLFSVITFYLIPILIALSLYFIYRKKW